MTKKTVFYEFQSSYSTYCYEILRVQVLSLTFYKFKFLIYNFPYLESFAYLCGKQQ